MRGEFGVSDFQRPEAIRQDGDDVVGILYDAFNEEKRMADQSDPVFLENGRLDHNVGDTSFILEAQKKKSSGS